MDTHLKNFFSRIAVFFLIMLSIAFSTSEATPLRFPFTSHDTSRYYIPNSNLVEFYAHPYLQSDTVNFNEQEASIPIKGEYFSFDTVNAKIRYYEIKSFEMGDHHYKIIIYNRFGEGDAFYLNIQLNSYDADGDLVDALLLDSRYSYEDVESYRDFAIEEDGNIKITLYYLSLGGGEELEDFKVLEDIPSSAYADKKYTIEDYYAQDWRIGVKLHYRINSGKIDLISEEKLLDF